MTVLLEALARASLAGAPFAVLALATSRLFPRLPAPARATLAWLACARFLLALAPLPAIELPVLPAREAVTVAPARAPVPVPAPGSVTGPASGSATGPASASASAADPASGAASESAPVSASESVPFAALLALWSLGVAGALGRLAAERRRIRRLVAAARPVPPEHPAAAVWRSLGGDRRRPGLLPAPRLALSREVRAPLCAGALAPVVVLPEVALGERGLRLALAHELGHLRRGDLWFAWIPALAGALFWFHPLVRLAAREHAQAREEACDAFALRHTGGEPAEYGPLLLAFGTGHGRLALAAAAGAPHVRQLERRLRMLLVHDRNGRRARWLTAAVLAALAPALAPVALGSVAAPEDPEGGGAAPVAAPAPVPPPAPAAPAPGPGRVVPVPPPPPVPPAGRVASVPPVPPAPPALLAARDGEFIVFKKDGRTSISTGGGVAEERLAEAMRGRKPPYALIGRGGRTYVVEDPARLAELEALFEDVGHDEEMAAATLDQTRLAAEQAELARRQADAGARQARLAVGMAEVEVESRRKGADRAALDRRREDLSRQMDAIGAEMEKAGAEMDRIGDRMEETGRRVDGAGRRIEQRAHRAEEEARRVVDGWIRSGAAKAVE